MPEVVSVSAVVDGDKKDLFTINHYLAGMFEHDGDARPDAGLHLTAAPVAAVGMFHDHARLEKLIHTLNHRGRPLL